MTDDLVNRLRQYAVIGYGFGAIKVMEEAAVEIERLLANAKSDAQFLKAYHTLCRLNGFAPSSSDLIEAMKVAKAMETEKKDD